MKYDLGTRIKKARRQRRYLITFGVPLAVATFALVYVYGGPWAVVLGLLGGYVATRTWDMIVTHEPALDDPYQDFR